MRDKRERFTPPVMEEVKDSVEETVEDTVEEIVEEEAVEVVEEPVKEDVIGVVTGCAKLRVREAASANAKVLCEISENSEVIINEAESTKDFYKVCTEAGVEGFCMKKYITVR